MSVFPLFIFERVSLSNLSIVMINLNKSLFDMGITKSSTKPLALLATRGIVAFQKERGRDLSTLRREGWGCAVELGLLNNGSYQTILTSNIDGLLWVFWFVGQLGFFLYLLLFFLRIFSFQLFVVVF